MVKKLFPLIIIFVFFINLVSATYFVKDPNNCPITSPFYPGQSCSPIKICGNISGIAQCYDTSTILIPSSYNASYQTNVISGLDEGYVLDCFAPTTCVDKWFCSVNSTCEDMNRITICNSITITECNGCKAGYYDCDGDNLTCEIHNGDICSVGSLNGTYSECNCVITPQHHITGQNAQYNSTNPNLWTTQYGSGYLMNLTNGVTNQTFAVDNDACIIFSDGSSMCSAPTEIDTLQTVTDRGSNTTHNITANGFESNEFFSLKSGNFHVNNSGMGIDYITPFGSESVIFWNWGTLGPTVIIDNNISGTDVVNLRLRGKHDQTANFFEITDENDNLLAYIDASGTIFDASGQVCTPANGLCNQTFSENYNGTVEWINFEKPDFIGGNITTTGSVSLNHTLLNNLYNDTNLISAVNTTNNIKSLGFNTTSELGNLFITGSGVVGYIPLWNGTAKLNSSRIFQNSSHTIIYNTANQSIASFRDDRKVFLGTEQSYGGPLNIYATAGGNNYYNDGVGFRLTHLSGNFNNTAGEYFLSYDTHTSGSPSTYGSMYEVQAAHSGTASGGSITAMYVVTRQSSSNPLTYMYGLYPYVYVQGSGAVSGAYGIYMPSYIANGASLTYLYGVHIAQPNSYGTLYNAYGLYIGNFNKASNNNYAIYTEGGNVMFNLNENNALIVKGLANQTSNLQEWRNVSTVTAYVDKSGRIYETTGRVCTPANGLCNQTIAYGEIYQAEEEQTPSLEAGVYYQYNGTKAVKGLSYGVTLQNQTDSGVSFIINSNGIYKFDSHFTITMTNNTDILKLKVYKNTTPQENCVTQQQNMDATITCLLNLSTSDVITVRYSVLSTGNQINFLKTNMNLIKIQ